MKNQLLLLSIALLSIVSFSCKKNLVYADYTRGGGGSSTGGAPLEPSPTGFKRNNGNGTCNGAAQIRVLFANTKPSYAPTLINIFQPVNGYLGSALSGYTFDAADIAHMTDNNPYSSFCIHSSTSTAASAGNIPPANTLVLEFYYPLSNQYFLIDQEGDPYYL